MTMEVFVDFDGTITDLDTFDVLVRECTGAHRWEELESKLHAGSMTLREVLAAQAAGVRASLDEADALLSRQTRFDPGFASFVRRCEAKDVPLTVLSSGVAPLIERAFARQGLAHVRILANGIDASPEGWRFLFRDDSDNGHDKAAAVRAARERGAFTVFVGDGPSDYEAALVAERRFAKSGRALETYLRGRAIPHTAFTSFHEIETALFR
jgi:2,3-diketo-5-methylthio-1-phosphopentane phosphatase